MEKVPVVVPADSEESESRKAAHSKWQEINDLAGDRLSTLLSVSFREWIAVSFVPNQFVPPCYCICWESNVYLHVYHARVGEYKAICRDTGLTFKSDSHPHASSLS